MLLVFDARFWHVYAFLSVPVPVVWPGHVVEFKAKRVIQFSAAPSAVCIRHYGDGAVFLFEVRQKFPRRSDCADVQPAAESHQFPEVFIHGGSFAIFIVPMPRKDNHLQ